MGKCVQRQNEKRMMIYHIQYISVFTVRQPREKYVLEAPVHPGVPHCAAGALD